MPLYSRTVVILEENDKEKIPYNEYFYFIIWNFLTWM